MRIQSIVLALSAAALAIPATAAESNAGVRYSDLDLTTEHGQEVLANRIDLAARAMCGMNDVRTGTIMPRGKARACYEQAKASATQLIAERVAQDKRG
jgi:UrcA family protein